MHGHTLVDEKAPSDLASVLSCSPWRTGYWLPTEPMHLQGVSDRKLLPQRRKSPHSSAHFPFWGCHCWPHTVSVSSNCHWAQVMEHGSLPLETWLVEGPLAASAASKQQLLTPRPSSQRLRATRSSYLPSSEGASRRSGSLYSGTC